MDNIYYPNMYTLMIYFYTYFTDRVNVFSVEPLSLSKKVPSGVFFDNSKLSAMWRFILG